MSSVFRICAHLLGIRAPHRATLIDLGAALPASLRRYPAVRNGAGVLVHVGCPCGRTLPTCRPVRACRHPIIE